MIVKIKDNCVDFFCQCAFSIGASGSSQQSTASFLKKLISVKLLASFLRH